MREIKQMQIYLLFISASRITFTYQAKGYL